MSTLAGHALSIAEILTKNQPNYVSEDILAEDIGIPGYAIRWYIFQLRQAGYVVEAAIYADPDAFSAGERGWKLSRIQETAYVPLESIDLDGAREFFNTNTEALATIVARTRKARKRTRIRN